MLCIQWLKFSVISRGLELKMQLFRESLCMQELKVLQFSGSCDFQGFVHARLHILRSPWGCYRIQKPLKSGNTKKYEKITKSPISGLAPKIRKNYRKNYKIGHFLANFVIFR